MQELEPGKNADAYFKRPANGEGPTALLEKVVKRTIGREFADDHLRRADGYRKCHLPAARRVL